VPQLFTEDCTELTTLLDDFEELLTGTLELLLLLTNDELFELEILEDIRLDLTELAPELAWLDATPPQTLPVTTGISAVALLLFPWIPNSTDCPG